MNVGSACFGHGLGLELGGYALYPVNPWPHKNHARLAPFVRDLVDRLQAGTERPADTLVLERGFRDLSPGLWRALCERPRTWLRSRRWRGTVCPKTRGPRRGWCWSACAPPGADAPAPLPSRS